VHLVRLATSLLKGEEFTISLEYDEKHLLLTVVTSVLALRYLDNYQTNVDLL